MNTHDLMPARAAAAATALARLPVDAHAIVVKPSARAAASATVTTRSLNECVGLPLSSFTHNAPGFMPIALARLSARCSRVIPAARLGWSAASDGTGSRPAYRHRLLGPAAIDPRVTRPSSS